MFLISDTLETRQSKIRDFLKRGEPAIAVLLAAADCERTVRRAILALGVTPTLELAHRLGRPRPDGWTSPVPKPPKYRSSIDGYADAWGVELARFERELLGDVAGPKKEIYDAFQLRHDLVHGDEGTTGQGYAQAQVERLLSVTVAVTDFAREHGADLERPLRKRLKPRRSE